MQQHQFPDTGASTAERSDGRDTQVPTSGICQKGAAPCLACGSMDVVVIGERQDTSERFNACCERCALLQLTPGEATVGRSLADSRLDGSSARSRAVRISLGANIKMGDAVLSFGAYGAQLAAELDAMFGIDAHVFVDVAKGVSLPSSAVAFTDDVKAYDPGLQFDAVLALHVAHLWADPLGTLLHLRKLLKPSGALIVEVPNVLPDGEFEVEAFLGPGSASSFSLNTIRLLLLRAGYHVEVARNDDTVVLSCRIDPAVKVVPVPFRTDMLRTAEQNGDWLLPRLATYVGAEQIRDEVVNGNTDVATTRAFLELLRQPAFDDHLVNIAVEIVQAYAEAGSFHAARMIAGAAAVSLPEQYRDALRRLTDALG